jgi:hypothetical protein
MTTWYYRHIVLLSQLEHFKSNALSFFLLVVQVIRPAPVEAKKQNFEGNERRSSMGRFGRQQTESFGRAGFILKVLQMNVLRIECCSGAVPLDKIRDLLLIRNAVADDITAGHTRRE